MNALAYVQILGKLLSAYSTGNFKTIDMSLSDDCLWESDWKSDTYSGRNEIKKYYSKKGVILNMSKAFPTGHVVDLFGSEDSIDGKGLYLAQTLDGKNYDLILKIKLDRHDYISAINLCMKELYRFRYYDAALPQY